MNLTCFTHLTCDVNGNCFFPDLGMQELDNDLKGNNTFFLSSKHSRCFISQVNSLPLPLACACQPQLVISDISQNMFLKSGRQHTVCSSGLHVSYSEEKIGVM